MTSLPYHDVDVTHAWYTAAVTRSHAGRHRRRRRLQLGNEFYGCRVQRHGPVSVYSAD